jgi:hypothetical protein
VIPGHANIPLLPDSDLFLYRSHAQAILRRYYRVSHEIGRLPSLLGGVVFRARVTSYRLHTFEDLVIFVHDVERCLMQLPDFRRQVIMHVIFQGYNPAESAHILGCTHRTARRALARAIDELTCMFLQREILCLFPSHMPEDINSASPPQRALESSPPRRDGKRTGRDRQPAFLAGACAHRKMLSRPRFRQK